MHSSKFQIGEHVVRIETDSDNIQSWLTYSFGGAIQNSEYFDLCIRVIETYGFPFESFDVEITSTEEGIVYRRTDYCIEVNPTYCKALISVYDTFALKHALMNLYSAFIVHRGWGLLLHSSCVVQDGNAVLFCGHSGAGKSTVAKLSVPRLLLSNEATILKVDTQHPFVFNSYAFRSDPGIFADEPASLSSVYFLRQSKTIHVEKMNSSEMMMQLMDKVFFWPHNPEETIKLVKLIKKLTQSTIGYELYFQKNDLFWSEIDGSSATYSLSQS